MSLLGSQAFLNSSTTFAAAQLPTFTLSHIFGTETYEGLSVGTIDSIIGHGRSAPLRDMAGIGHDELLRAHDFLNSIDVNAPPEHQAAALFYQDFLLRLTHEPSGAEIDQHFREVINDCPDHIRRKYAGQQMRVYNTLSREARNAVYVLLRSGNVFPSRIRRFLLNPHLAELGGRDAILRLILELYSYRVDNYHRVFIPTRSDEKLLGDTETARSHLRELEFALWLARHSDASKIQMDPKLPIDWADLTDSERAFIKREIIPLMSLELRYQFDSHRFVMPDLSAKLPRGRNLIEVKSCRQWECFPGSEERARNLLQIIRYGMVARQQGYDGIEYVIYTRWVHSRYLSLLKEALDVTGVPYLIRVIDRQSRIVVDGGLDYTTSERPYPGRKRSLPPIPSGTA